MGAGASKKVNPGLAELVAAADTDKDGIISVEELDAMLQETGIDWPRKRKEKLLGALDEDGDGKVGLAELVKGTEQLLAVLEKLHAMGVVQLAVTVPRCAVVRCQIWSPLCASKPRTPPSDHPVTSVSSLISSSDDGFAEGTLERQRDE